MNTELIQVCEEMLICGICGKKIKQPKYLPCHHSFCFECIVGTLKLNQQKIACTVCYATHTLSFEQMNMLSNDTMKGNLIIPFMNEKLKFQKTKCDICDDDEEVGVSACVDCEIFLCDLHQKAHFKAKETKTHQVIAHSTNPYVVGNKHNSQSSGPHHIFVHTPEFPAVENRQNGHDEDTLRSMKAQPRPYTPTTPPNVSSNSLSMILVPSPTNEYMTSTPPYKRKLEDTSDDEKTPRKRGRKAGAHDQKWDQNFEILKTMKAQTGNFNFIRENPALHGWVQYMKASYKRGKLAPERVEALDQIGFTWTTKEKLQIRWDQRLDQLRQYKEIHGNCNVPSTAKGDYSGLGQWLASTRMKKRKGHLSDSKTQDLEEIGVEWSLKRTTKVTVSQTSVPDDFYDDDDSESNNNDDYDEDEPDSSMTNNPTSSTSISNSNHNFPNSIPNTSLSNTLPSNYVNNNNFSNSNGNLNTSITSLTNPNNYKDRPIYIAPPPPVSGSQSNNAKMLDFLTGCIGDVVKKDKGVSQV